MHSYGLLYIKTFGIMIYNQHKKLPWSQTTIAWHCSFGCFSIIDPNFLKLNFFFLEVWSSTFVISLLIIPLRVEILVIGPYPWFLDIKI